MDKQITYTVTEGAEATARGGFKTDEAAWRWVDRT